MADRRVPGTNRFLNPAERDETRIRAARLLVRIAKEQGETVDPEVAADAALPLPGERVAS